LNKVLLFKNKGWFTLQTSPCFNRTTTYRIGQMPTPQLTPLDQSYDTRKDYLNAAVFPP